MSDSSSLPNRVDPRRLAATGGAVEGELALSELRRLGEHLGPEETVGQGRVSVALAFDEDSERRVRVTGRIQASLTLQCQRCLGSAPWRIDQPLRLVVVADEDAAAEVPRDCDPVVATAEGLDPAALVEDELILALPLVARCERPECVGRTAEAESGKRREDNPFAALAALRERGRNDGGPDE